MEKNEIVITDCISLGNLVGNIVGILLGGIFLGMNVPLTCYMPLPLIVLLTR